MAKDSRVFDSLPARQFAALCWRMRKGVLEVLLVTSRETRRWVIPKGWPIEGLSPAETAAREAWEEAGVEGRVEPAAIGAFGYDKAIDNRKILLPCHVEVFALRVEKVRSRFPEAEQRVRKWHKAAKAAKLVQEQGLADLIRGFDPPPLDPAQPAPPPPPLAAA